MRNDQSGEKPSGISDRWSCESESMYVTIRYGLLHYKQAKEVKKLRLTGAGTSKDWCGIIWISAHARVGHHK